MADKSSGKVVQDAAQGVPAISTAPPSRTCGPKPRPRPNVDKASKGKLDDPGGRTFPPARGPADRMTGALEATNLHEWAVEQVDMAPHYMTLTKAARECTLIVEFGVRGGVSTWALLDGLYEGGHLFSVDIVDCVVPPRVSEDPQWTFIVGSDMDERVQAQLPEKADLVFIDTDHEYDHTVREIEYALTFNPRRIIFHDYVMEPVRQAVDEFLVESGWHLVDNELPYGLATIEP